MPELPEVETVRRGLLSLRGQSIAAVRLGEKKLRRPFPQDLISRLENRTVEEVERRAKYLLLFLSGKEVLLLHLGMSGAIRLLLPEASGQPENIQKEEEKQENRGKQAPELDKHEHLGIRFDNGSSMVFKDPRRFGLVDLVPAEEVYQHPLLKGLGVEPLGSRLTCDFLAHRLKNRKAAIKQLLLDQRILAGVGNIYASEALFRARINPEKAGKDLTRKQIECLVPAIQDVLKDAIASGGSSLRNHLKTDGEVGYFQHNFRVYDRQGQPCPRCTEPAARPEGPEGREKKKGEWPTVIRISQGGRSTFFCPNCQK